MKPRILFIPMSWGRGLGPLTDCLAIAEELNRTCEVAFVCKEAFISPVRQAGYSWYPIMSPPDRKEVDHEFYVDFPYFQGLGDELLIRHMIAQEIEAMSDFRPDAVFAWLQFTTSITARCLGVPLASKANWPDHPRFVPPSFAVPLQPSRVTPIFNRLLTEYNLPTMNNVWELSFLRSDLKVAPTIPEFEPDLEGISNLHYVGHLVYSGFELANQPDWLSNWDESRPTVFVYLSAKQFRVQDCTQVIVDQFDGTEFQVIVALGGHVPTDQIPKSTQNIRFEQLVPAHVMLSKSDVFITTGTRGSTSNALLHGVSMVLFPGVDVEMGLNAYNIEKYGAGIRLPDAAFFTRQLVDTVSTVMRPDSRKRALALGNRLKSFGGPSRAANLIEELACVRRSD